MTDRPPSRGARPPARPSNRRGANAGYLLISPAILGAAMGAGIGALLGIPGVLAVIGVFAGLMAGFFLVHARFRDL
jgi:hypothetical protein